LKKETHDKNRKIGGLETFWYGNGEKKHTKHFNDGIENGIRKEWDENEKLTFKGNYIDGVEDIK
jgi:antitoxin component YwqK of YwqJK toxin-antitoxin module